MWVIRTLSLSARRAWIEISTCPGSWILAPSLSARRAWIEICYVDPVPVNYKVALRKESVDRNKPYSVRDITGTSVALRKESVDRNSSTIIYIMVFVKSLSARRAWIEILVFVRQVCIVRRRSPQGERG